MEVGVGAKKGRDASVSEAWGQSHRERFPWQCHGNQVLPLTPSQSRISMLHVAWAPKNPAGISSELWLYCCNLIVTYCLASSGGKEKNIGT